jgi:hypothetical protein
MVGYNSPPMSYWGSPYGYGPAYGYGYAPGYAYEAGPGPGPVVGRSVYAGPRYKRHHNHW